MTRIIRRRALRRWRNGWWSCLSPVPVTLDTEASGFDHGSWGVLIKMYPQADIPMVQLSIDSTKPPAWHLEMGRKLASLRDEGIMLVASGNVVHNLRTARLAWREHAVPLGRVLQ